MCAVVAMIAVGGCSSDPPTKTAFVEHGLEISTNVTTDEERESWTRWYGCAYDELSGSAGVLSEFVSVDELGDLSSDAAEQLNEAIRDCLTGADADS